MKRPEHSKRTPAKRSVTIDFPMEVYNAIKSAGDRDERNFGAQVRFILKQWIEAQSRKTN